MAGGCLFSQTQTQTPTTTHSDHIKHDTQSLAVSATNPHNTASTKGTRPHSTWSNPTKGAFLSPQANMPDDLKEKIRRLRSGQRQRDRERKRYHARKAAGLPPRKLKPITQEQKNKYNEQRRAKAARRTQPKKAETQTRHNGLRIVQRKGLTNPLFTTIGRDGQKHRESLNEPLPTW